MKKASKMGLGRRLREVRESIEMTQGELADAAGMDQSLLSKYEREDVSPSWLQIERLLEAMGQSVVALFADECRSGSDSQEDYFTIQYYSSKPKDPSTKDIPTSSLRVHKDTMFVKVLHLPPIDNRFIVAKAEDDIMIPDWYPGDYLVIDRGQEPKAGRIIVGFLDGVPMARRLVRDGKNVLLVASNRHYPPIPFDQSKWEHGGVLEYACRDMTKRYTGE